MIQTTKLCVLLFLILGFSSSLIAQESHPPQAKYQQFMTEAFGEDVYNDIQNNKVFAPLYKDLYENRILYLKRTDSDRPLKQPLFLKDIELTENKFKTLTRDVSFNPLTFNLFKYNLPFFDSGDQFIKVDNSEYVIIIRSKKTL